MKKKEILKEIGEWLYCAVIALILALTIRYFLGTPTVVKQSSMYDTLESNQRLILNRWARTIKSEIKRGDIITFESPSKIGFNEGEVDLEHPEAVYKTKKMSFIERIKYSVLEIDKTTYIKRVIGVAGDHILIQDGNVYLNGEKLEEDYILEGAVTNGESFYDIVVPDGYVYVMGDNRERSTDSRAFGCIPLKKVDSKIFIRFWPMEKFGKVN